MIIVGLDDGIMTKQKRKKQNLHQTNQGKPALFGASDVRVCVWPAPVAGCRPVACFAVISYFL